MSFFAGTDFNAVADDPFAAPVGTWLGTISDVTTFIGKKDAAQTFLKLEWTNTETGETFDDLFKLPYPGKDPVVAKRDTSMFKQRMLKLEIPAERMNTIGKDDLIGLRAWITTKKNGDYTNIDANSVKLVEDGDDITTPPVGSKPLSGSANPFEGL